MRCLVGKQACDHTAYDPRHAPNSHSMKVEFVIKDRSMGEIRRTDSIERQKV